MPLGVVDREECAIYFSVSKSPRGKVEIVSSLKTCEGGEMRSAAGAEGGDGGFILGGGVMPEKRHVQLSPLLH